MQATLPNDGITILLNKVKRTQMVAGKAQDQVLSCVLEVKNDPSPVASVTSLVKDGLTSLSRFSCLIERQKPCKFYITDIDTFLGALKYHGTMFTLTQDGEKLRIKSSNKQTTLMASPDALAFPHNPATRREWHTTSTNLANKLVRKYLAHSHNSDGAFVWHYLADGGEKIPTKFRRKTDAVTLYEALRCDSMNGQKINRYTFHVDGDKETLQVEVGKSLKGRTKSDLACEGQFRKYSSFDATFEGGLEQLMSTVGGSVGLSFFDFSKEGQGRKLLIDFGNRDFVFQSAIQ